jgi:hypothetical protein
MVFGACIFRSFFAVEAVTMSQGEAVAGWGLSHTGEAPVVPDHAHLSRRFASRLRGSSCQGCPLDPKKGGLGASLLAT